MRRLIFRTLSLPLIAIVLFGAMIAAFQQRLLYLPENPPAAAIFAAAAREGLQPWPSPAHYRGLLRTPAGPVRCTVVLFHGNAGHAGDRAWYADRLPDCRVILAEYPGYGSRPGELGETALVSDAAASLALVRRQFPEPLIVAGESLGAGVATAVAAESQAAALLLITPWDQLAHAAAHHYPWLPVRLLLRDRYDSVANLAAWRGRLAVVIADADRVIPPRYGQALFDQARQAKRLWRIPGADHNDWGEHVDPAWWQTLNDYLLARPATPDELP